MEMLKHHTKVHDCKHLFMKVYPTAFDIRWCDSPPKPYMQCVNCGAYKEIEKFD